MLMWGKWRIYNRKQYDEGKAKPPPRRGKRRINGRIKNDKRSLYDSSIAVITVEENDAQHSSNIEVHNSADNPYGSSPPRIFLEILRWIMPMLEATAGLG